MVTHQHLSGIINGVNMTLSLLIHELHERGHLSQTDFAARLQSVVDRRPNDLDDPSAPRLDLLMLGNLAKLLRSQPGHWKPVVVPGGKEEEE